MNPIDDDRLIEIFDQAHLQGAKGAVFICDICGGWGEDYFSVRHTDRCPDKWLTEVVRRGD
ncbi:MAG: hypothetical protein JRI59_06020 [Deltaproteobacteria bacterium]|nr:hypothetical protein [Deltaproteobacteria bacterium]